MRLALFNFVMAVFALLVVVWKTVAGDAPGVVSWLAIALCYFVLSLWWLARRARTEQLSPGQVAHRISRVFLFFGCW